MTYLGGPILGLHTFPPLTNAKIFFASYLVQSHQNFMIFLMSQYLPEFVQFSSFSVMFCFLFFFCKVCLPLVALLILFTLNIYTSTYTSCYKLPEGRDLALLILYFQKLGQKHL